MSLPQSRRHQCTIDGHGVRLQPKTAQLLVLLLTAHPDRGLSMVELVEGLWPDADDQPDTATKQIGTYLWQLRQAGVPVVNEFAFCWRVPAGAIGGGQHRRRLAA